MPLFLTVAFLFVYLYCVMDDRPRVCLPVLPNWTRPCVSLPGDWIMIVLVFLYQDLVIALLFVYLDWLLPLSICLPVISGVVLVFVYMD